MFGFAAGALVARASRRAFANVHDDPIRSRYFIVVAFYGAAVLAPSGLSLYSQYPDWSLMYFANPQHLPSIVMFPALTLAYVLGPPAGFLVTHRLQLEKKDWVVRAILMGIAAVLFALLAFGWDRLTSVGYYYAYHHGLADLSLFRSALLVPIVLHLGAVFGVLGFALRGVRGHLDEIERHPHG